MFRKQEAEMEEIIWRFRALGRVYISSFLILFFSFMLK